SLTGSPLRVNPKSLLSILAMIVCLLPPAHLPQAAPANTDQMQKTILFSMIISQFQELCREIFCIQSIIFQDIFGEFHRHVKNTPPPVREAGAIECRPTEHAG